MVPHRFFTHGQRSTGDRHVYAQRTRFIPDSVLGHVWTAPAVQEESDLSAKRSGAAMYSASHDGISVKS